MATADLTPENFIKKIKMMDAAERNQLKLKNLIALIVNAPLFTYDDDATIINMRTEMNNLAAQFRVISTIATKNQEEIVTIKAENTTLVQENNNLKREVETMKAERENDNGANELKTKVEELSKRIDEIDQYLRVNNLEIVGLPEPDEEAGETDEKLIINAVNTLADLPEPIRPEDIDISHPLKTKRKDHKNVHVVRFISRKKKAEILTAKKSINNRNFKFRDNDVFINEHLSPANRTLFATAQTKKKALGYKFLWTRGGDILMRKTDTSEAIFITCENDLNNLV